MVKRICENCVYWDEEGENAGWNRCRRTNQYISRLPWQWCGEGLFKVPVNDSIALTDITGNRQGFHFPEEEE